MNSVTQEATSDSSEVPKSHSCALCLDSMDGEEFLKPEERQETSLSVFRLPCGHAFHAKCILVGRIRVCPVCRDYFVKEATFQAIITGTEGNHEYIGTAKEISLKIKKLYNDIDEGMRGYMEMEKGNLHSKAHIELTLLKKGTYKNHILVTHSAFDDEIDSDAEEDSQDEYDEEGDIKINDTCVSVNISIV